MGHNPGGGAKPALRQTLEFIPNIVKSHHVYLGLCTKHRNHGSFKGVLASKLPSLIIRNRISITRCQQANPPDILNPTFTIPRLRIPRATGKRVLWIDFQISQLLYTGRRSSFTLRNTGMPLLQASELSKLVQSTHVAGSV